MDISKFGRTTTAKEVVDYYANESKIHSQNLPLHGKVAIVTGGNSGLGLETCKALLYAGCKRVILCARSVSSAESAVNAELLKPGLGNYIVSRENLWIRELDLSSFHSIKSFSEKILEELSEIHFLVCNAGIMALPNLERTENGYEKQIGVNHFGHFFLTMLLMPLMLKTAAASGVRVRVIVLSSSAISLGSVQIDDLNFEHGRVYNPLVAYGQSKIANFLFAKELSIRYGKHGVDAIAIHPGVIRTRLFDSFHCCFRVFVLSLILNKSVPQGAATTVFCALISDQLFDKLKSHLIQDCRNSMSDEIINSIDPQLSSLLWVVSTKEYDKLNSTISLSLHTSHDGAISIDR